MGANFEPQSPKKQPSWAAASGGSVQSTAAPHCQPVLLILQHGLSIGHGSSGNVHLLWTVLPCRVLPFLNYISSEAPPSYLTEVLQPPASTLTPTSGVEVNSRYISCFFSPPDGFNESERGLIRADAVTAGVSMALQCGRSWTFNVSQSIFLFVLCVWI